MELGEALRGHVVAVGPGLNGAVQLNAQLPRDRRGHTPVAVLGVHHELHRVRGRAIRPRHDHRGTHEALAVGGRDARDPRTVGAHVHEGLVGERRLAVRGVGALGERHEIVGERDVVVGGHGHGHGMPPRWVMARDQGVWSLPAV